MSGDLTGELGRAADFRSALRRFLARTDEVAASAGLTPQRYNLLLMIRTGRDESSTVTGLCERLALRQTAVTELVKRAQEAGLVVRTPSPRDGRVGVLRLTDEGERQLMDAFVGLRQARRELAQVLDEVGLRYREYAGIGSRRAAARTSRQ